MVKQVTEKRMLSEAEGYDLLKKNDIPVPEHKIAKNADEAIKTAEEIGYPVAMKIVSLQVVHKSDAGGVVIGVQNKEEVKNAFDKIMPVSYTHLRAHGTVLDLVCRLLLE